METDERRPQKLRRLPVAMPVFVLVSGKRQLRPPADPRSYCIHKTLYDVSHNGSIKDNLLFAGHQVYRFATDPLYRNGVPSVKELIEKIKKGE